MRYILLVPLMLLASYSLASESPDMNSQIISIYSKNGEKAWCMQEGYLACTNTTQKQCISEQSVNKERCLKNASWRVPSVNDGKSAGDYSEAFMVCMANEHIYEFYKSSKEMSSCILKVKIDSKLLQKHVYEAKAE